MTGNVLLEAQGLSKRYGGVVAVNDVSLKVSAGEIVGLVGPNGAGKTTIIDLITGAQSADTGNIVLSGHALSGSPSRRAAQGLARTFQHPQLALDLTVRENIIVGQTARRLRSILQIVGEMLRGMFGRKSGLGRAGLDELCARLNLYELDRQCRSLTLGEHRLTEVARAIVQDPSVLILDEPFAGSDSAGAVGIGDAIRAVRDRGLGVILVDHNVDLVASLADRIVLLQLGQVVFEGTPEACLSSAEMREVYFGSRGVH